MLSSQRLWPRSWSICVAFISSPFSGSCARVLRIVPQSNHRLGPVVLVAERGEARRAQQQISPGRGLEPEPAGAQHPQEMPAREEQDVSPRFPHAAHHAVGPGADLVWRLAARAAVAEELPVGTLGVNLGAGASLILPVVPFDQILVDLGSRPESSQLAR